MAATALFAGCHSDGTIADVPDCVSISDCGSGETCYESLCRALCTGPGDCSASEICTDGVCVDAPFEPDQFCTDNHDCELGHHCSCADAVCEYRVCNAVPCSDCLYTEGDGACAAGAFLAGLDPNDACDLACDGRGACQVHDGEPCFYDTDCPSEHACACAGATCATAVCNAVDCSACTFSDGSGGCDAGNIEAGLDPNDACDLACDGYGACLVDGQVECSGNADCAGADTCECANPTCSRKVCTGTECIGCWYTDGQGDCQQGAIAAGLDPNDACALACNGSGDCQVADGGSCSTEQDCQSGHYCYCADADCAGFVCTDQPPPALSPEPAEFIAVSWNHRAGAEYSLDVRPVGQADFVGPCVSAGILGADRLSYIFNGICPSADAEHRTVDAVHSFRLCSCAPAGNSCWQNPDRDVRCTTQAYEGGSTFHINSPKSAIDGVVLRWPSIPESSYCLHLHLRDGRGVVTNCANAGVIGTRNDFVFKGACPSSTTHPTVSLSDIAYFEINSAVDDEWANPDARDKAVAAYDGTSDEIALSFNRFHNYYFQEECTADPLENQQYASGHTMTAHTCVASGDAYQKRRLVEWDDYSMMGYPRSYLDDDGRLYLLFSTPRGGFPPAGGSVGQRELNLVRTTDFVHYELVAQIDRIEGNVRLENGEINVLDGRMYISYNTFSTTGDCITGGGSSGRTWNLRLKVSDDYGASTPSFVDLGGSTSPEILHSECIADDSLDGFWEPYLYRTDANELRVLYADDTPSEAADGNCNQVIRMLRYSETERRELGSTAIGACPGDKRDGMPVVARWPDGRHVVVFESLGAPANQIVMLTSADGRSWGTRNIIADVRVDGGTGVGCPYVRIHDNCIYVSYYHAFLDPVTNLEYSHYQIRVLDSDLNKLRDIVFEMRPRSAPGSIGLYYWGSINIVDNHILGFGAAQRGSHPFTEAWVPLP